ncbi:MAG TPA: hypothetical protein PKZ53_22030, partial [Acidobacteriota bacterium]|nr:hypothetical protein [Acidobacteriota bacterium]
LGGLHTTSPARRGGRGAMGAADERAVSQLRAQLESSMRQRQDLELDANRIREKADETRSRFDQALANIELDPNAVLDVDSEWWIETMKNARVNKEITVHFDDEP